MAVKGGWRATASADRINAVANRHARMAKKSLRTVKPGKWTTRASGDYLNKVFIRLNRRTKSRYAVGKKAGQGGVGAQRVMRSARGSKGSSGRSDG